MPENGNPDDGEQSESEPSNYREYRLSKNRRFADPDEAGPRDPAQDTERSSGFEDLEADEDVAKSLAEELDDALTDWDPLGDTSDVEKGTEEKVNLSLTEADLREAQMTTEDRKLALLRDIRDEMRAGSGSVSREDLAKALGKDTRAGQQWAALLEDEDADPVDLLDEVEGRLEAKQELAEAAQEAAEAFVEAGHSLSSPLSEFVPFLRDALPNQPDEQTERHVRGRALARIAGLENQAEDETPA